MDLKLDGLHLMHGDCLQRMAEIEPGSVDMVMCDPPYGTTACKWDSVIPLDAMWNCIDRVAKREAAMVFTAAQPFTSQLGASNLPELRYSWCWQKENATGHLNAKRMPMKDLEDVLVFYTAQPTYSPQGVRACDKVVRRGHNGDNYGKSGAESRQTQEGYPRQLLSIPRDSSRVHPTQKPVELMAYMIRTYTNPGDLVLDFTMGSGTTGVAAMQEGRRFIGIELDPGYYGTACHRIMEARAAC